MKNKFSKKELQPKEWIKRATDDELGIKSILKHKDAPANLVCFHSQQMAEKYLKAFLVSRKKWYPKIHPLDALLELCVKSVKTFEKLDDDVFLLTSFYSPTRYPGDYPEFSWQDAEKAFKAATRVKKFISKKLAASH